LTFRTEKWVENCAVIRYYAASSGEFLPTFRDNLSVLSSGFKNPIQNWFWVLEPWRWDP